MFNFGGDLINLKQIVRTKVIRKTFYIFFKDGTHNSYDCEQSCIKIKDFTSLVMSVQNEKLFPLMNGSRILISSIVSLSALNNYAVTEGEKNKFSVTVILDIVGEKLRENIFFDLIQERDKYIHYLNHERECFLKMVWL